jgi:hypothetical protein
MSTVLEIGQAIADEIGLPRENNLIGNSTQNARKILRSIQDGIFLDAFIDRDWEILKGEGTINLTGGGVTTYSLPSDFDRVMNGTIWDETNYKQVRGPVDKREWQDYNKGLAQLAGLELVTTIVGDLASNAKTMSFYPDTSAATVSFWYVSNKCVWSQGKGEAISEIQEDDNMPIMPTPVVRAAAKWRLLRMMGMDFQDERVEYFAILDDYSANDSGGKKINMGRHVKYDIANVPEVGFGS